VKVEEDDRLKGKDNGSGRRSKYKVNVLVWSFMDHYGFFSSFMALDGTLDVLPIYHLFSMYLASCRKACYIYSWQDIALLKWIKQTVSLFILETFLMQSE
jgi:hypothetical protein